MHAMTFHSTLGRITLHNDILFSCPSSIGNVYGIPSNILDEAMVNDNKVEINLIVSSLRQNRKKVKEFQRDRTNINFELGQMTT